MDVSADAPSATIGAMAEQEEEVEDDGKTVSLAKGGVTDLTRTAGRTSLARGLGEISLMRIAHKATQAFLLCHHHQEGMMTIIRMRGLGASRSRVLGDPRAPSCSALRMSSSVRQQPVSSQCSVP